MLSDNVANDNLSDHDDPDDSPIVLVLTVSFSEKLLASTNNNATMQWVCDSGATTSATFDPSDCIDLQDCSVRVTAAGTSFEGTAIVQALDTTGKAHTLHLTNCLISDKFPYKLLALQQFTEKGHTVVFKDREMRVSNPINNVTLCATQDTHSPSECVPPYCAQNKKQKSL